MAYLGCFVLPQQRILPSFISSDTFHETFLELLDLAGKSNHLRITSARIGLNLPGRLLVQVFANYHDCLTLVQSS